MSSTVTFLPIDHEGPGLAYSHTILTCYESSALSEAVHEILELHGQLAPATFKSFCADGTQERGTYGITLHDAYGAPLCWVPVHCLWDMALYTDVATMPRTRAVWAYLGAMDHDGKVAIYEY